MRRPLSWIVASQKCDGIQLLRGVAPEREHRMVAAGADGSRLRVLAEPDPRSPLLMLAMYAVRDPSLVTLSPVADSPPPIMRVALELPGTQGGIAPPPPAKDVIVEFLITIGLAERFEEPLFRAICSDYLTTHIIALGRLLKRTCGGAPGAAGEA